MSLNKTMELSDKASIDTFIKINSDKKVIVIQGLGFVGAVMSLVCANALTEEYAVIGIDLPTPTSLEKINAINSGFFPIISSDKKIDEYFKSAQKKGNLLATFDEYAYSKADYIIVDINLDVKKESAFNGDLNGYGVELNSFRKAMETIGKNCKEDVLILVETTVPPGTCEQVVKPTIISELKKRGLPVSNFKLGHSYERVMPGPDYIDSIQNFYRVYSGVNDKSADEIELF
jgi:UDP-N-acetyl-D-glucosamine dehydrogenase